MSRTLAIFNMKGGVGKSTTAYNLSAGLVKFHQKRVLLVDIDPQGNAAASLGIKIWELGQQLKDVLQRQADLGDVIVSTEAGVDVAPSNILLAEEEIPISGLPGRELLLKKALAAYADRYDYIIVDCPPNIGVFAINALLCSQQIVIPVDMSFLGLLGVTGIERALTMVRDYLDHPIEVMGVLATRYDGRNKLSREVHGSLSEHFNQRMFQTTIPETVKLREATSYGQSIFDYAGGSLGASAYRSFVNEVLAR